MAADDNSRTNEKPVLERGRAFLFVWSKIYSVFGAQFNSVFNKMYCNLLDDSSDQGEKIIHNRLFALTPDLQNYVVQVLKEQDMEPTEVLWKRIRPCIEFNPTGEISRIGGSRLGGLPDVPPKWEWPGMLEFLAQFNMEDLTPYDASGLLPKRGLLHIFAISVECEWDDAENYRIYFYDGELNLLQPASPPDEFTVLGDDSNVCETYMVYRPVAIEPFNAICLSDNAFGGEENEETAKALAHLEEAIDWRPGWRHKIFGSPDADKVVNIWNREAKRNYYNLSPEDVKALRDELEEWIVLFQMDSCGEVGTRFNDGRSYYFIIRKQDLAALRFDRVYLTM